MYYTGKYFFVEWQSRDTGNMDLTVGVKYGVLVGRHTTCAAVKYTARARMAVVFEAPPDSRRRSLMAGDGPRTREGKGGTELELVHSAQQLPGLSTVPGGYSQLQPYAPHGSVELRPFS